MNYFQRQLPRHSREDRWDGSNFRRLDCVVGSLVGLLVGLSVGLLVGSSVSATPTSPILTSATVGLSTLAKGVLALTSPRPTASTAEAAATMLALVFESGCVRCPRAQDMSGTPVRQSKTNGIGGGGCSDKIGLGIQVRVCLLPESARHVRDPQP